MIKSIEQTVLLKEIDQLQIDLSNKFIKPNLLVLEEYLYQLRQVLDEYVNSINQETECISISPEFKNDIDLQIGLYGKKALKKYPKGACYFITHSSFDFIKRESVNRLDLFFLNDFISHGGVFKTIWGQLRSEVFQTAFQIGNCYVDVANDAVLITKPKIEISLLSESRFKNVDNLSEFKAIKELYHQLEVYPNIYYPNLAVYLPFFFVKDDRLILEFNKVIFELLKKSQFIILENYLNHEFDLKELPKKLKNEIDDYFNGVRLNKRFEKILENRPFSGNKKEWIADSFYKNFNELDKNLVKSICTLFNQSKNRKYLK